MVVLPLAGLLLAFLDGYDRWLPALALPVLALVLPVLIVAARLFVNKGNRIAQGGWATAEFIGKGHDYFASFAGTLTVSGDRLMIDKL